MSNITAAVFRGVATVPDSAGIGEATLTGQPYGSLIGNNDSAFRDSFGGTLPGDVTWLANGTNSIYDISGGGTLTARNQSIWFDVLLSDFGGTGAASRVALDLTDCSMYCSFNPTDNSSFNGGLASAGDTQTGRWRLRNCDFVRTESTNGRYFFGGFTNNATDFDNLQLDIDGLKIENIRSTGQGTVVFGTAIVDLGASRLDDISLVGNCTVETKTFGAFYQLSPARCASSAQVTAGTANNGYNFRALHQGQDANNVPQAVAGSPTNAMLLVEFDHTPYFDTSQPLYGDRTTVSFQQNRRSAIWSVNPQNATAALPLVFHNGNAPSVAEPAEFRQMIGWNIEFTNDVGAATTTTTKLDFFEADGTRLASRVIPATWTNPAAAPRSILTRTQVGDTNDTGYWLEDFVGKWTNGNTTSVPVPRTNNLYVVRDFRYDHSYSNTLTPTESDNLTTQQKVSSPGVDLVDYLNSRTETSTEIAASANLSDYADVFPALRRVWYDDLTPDHQTSSFGISASGTTITFDRDVSFLSETGTTTITSTGYNARMASDATLTGDNTTFAFGTNTAAWFNGAFPSGITISGGEHENLTNMTNVTWTAEDSPLLHTRLTGIQDFENVFGNVTGNFRAQAPSAGLTLVASPAQVAQLTLAADSNITIQTFITFEIEDDVTGQLGGVHAHLYPLTTADRDYADQDAINILVANSINPTFPFRETNVTEGNRYVWAITRPGFLIARGVITVAAGNNVVTVPQRGEPNAVTRASANPMYQTSCEFQEMVGHDNEGLIEYRFVEGGNRADGEETNFLFEQMKSQPGIGEFVCKNHWNADGSSAPLSHSSPNSTELRLGTYVLGAIAGGTELQQTIGYVEGFIIDGESAADFAEMPGQAVSNIEDITVFSQLGTDIGSVPSIIVSAQSAGVTFGEVDSIVDRNLNEGTLTAIGRPV